MYMDSKFNEYKERFIEAVKAQYDGPLYACSIKIVAEFRFGTKRRKDLANAGKLEYDALNGIIYVDDSQISEIQATKIYSKEDPGITFSIYAGDQDVWASSAEVPDEE